MAAQVLFYSGKIKGLSRANGNGILCTHRVSSTLLESSLPAAVRIHLCWWRVVQPAGCTTRHQHKGASRCTRREVLKYYLSLSLNLLANSMKYSMDCELLSASLLTAFSTGIPIKSFFTGTSV